jgi:signal peptidase I
MAWPPAGSGTLLPAFAPPGALPADGWYPGSLPGEQATPRRGQDSGSALGSLRDVLETVILTVLIAAGIQMAVQSRLVEGSSMEPTLHNGQRLLINRLSYLSMTEPQRGDIVVFRAWDQDEDYIKRVIGAPGDEIEISGREVRVNGSVLDEPYLDSSIDYGHIGPLVIAPDQFYVMGDNRGNSSDSRLHGPLDREQVIGKAWVSYWPFDQLGMVSDSTSYAAGTR